MTTAFLARATAFLVAATAAAALGVFPAQGEVGGQSEIDDCPGQCIVQAGGTSTINQCWWTTSAAAANAMDYSSAGTNLSAIAGPGVTTYANGNVAPAYIPGTSSVQLDGSCDPGIRLNIIGKHRVLVHGLHGNGSLSGPDKSGWSGIYWDIKAKMDYLGYKTTSPTLGNGSLGYGTESFTTFADELCAHINAQFSGVPDHSVELLCKSLGCPAVEHMLELGKRWEGMSPQGQASGIGHSSWLLAQRPGRGVVLSRHGEPHGGPISSCGRRARVVAGSIGLADPSPNAPRAHEGFRGIGVIFVRYGESQAAG
ncbi:MAG TPA: hypothetical protein EYG06_12170 [Myxococcales bacterium]|nr:hypothetical protein [Myxococcales bacterium]